MSLLSLSYSTITNAPSSWGTCRLVSLCSGDAEGWRFVLKLIDRVCAFRDQRAGSATPLRGVRLRGGCAAGSGPELWNGEGVRLRPVRGTTTCHMYRLLILKAFCAINGNSCKRFDIDSDSIRFFTKHKSKLLLAGKKEIKKHKMSF